MIRLPVFAPDGSAKSALVSLPLRRLPAADVEQPPHQRLPK
jgi:hypothetical protein